MRRLAAARLCAAPAASAASARGLATGIFDRLKRSVGLGGPVTPQTEAAQPSATTPPAQPAATPPSAADDDISGDGVLTIDAYAAQLRRARQLSNLASLLPAGAAAAAGGDGAVAATLAKQEAVLGAMTAAERLRPAAELSAAARARVAAEVGCTVADVGAALAKYEWTRAAYERVAELKRQGKPTPSSFSDMEATLGSEWRAKASARAAAAASGRVAAPAAARGAPGAGAVAGAGAPTRLLHGRPVGAVAPPAKGAPARNGPCPCGSGNKYKRCCADKDGAARA